MTSASAATTPAAHFALGDAKVRFVSENIDMVVYKAMASRDGSETQRDN